MRKTIFAATAALSLAFTTAALAAATPQPQQMAQSISASNSRQVVCHHLVHEGALMPHQVCLTKRSWERMRIQTEMAVADFEMGRGTHW
jgi:hypothetical protein